MGTTPEEQMPSDQPRGLTWTSLIGLIAVMLVLGNGALCCGAPIMLYPDPVLGPNAGPAPTGP